MRRYFKDSRSLCIVRLIYETELRYPIDKKLFVDIAFLVLKKTKFKERNKYLIDPFLNWNFDNTINQQKNPSIIFLHTNPIIPSHFQLIIQ